MGHKRARLPHGSLWLPPTSGAGKLQDAPCTNAGLQELDIS